MKKTNDTETMRKLIDSVIKDEITWAKNKDFFKRTGFNKDEKAGYILGLNGARKIIKIAVDGLYKIG